jgi:predicted secreted protein
MNIDKAKHKYTESESQTRQRLTAEIKLLRQAVREAKKNNEFRSFTDEEVEWYKDWLCEDELQTMLNKGKSVAKEKQNEIKDKLFAYHDKFYQKALRDLRSKSFSDPDNSKINTNAPTSEFLEAKKALLKREIYSKKSVSNDLKELCEVILDQIQEIKGNKSYVAKSGKKLSVSVKLNFTSNLEGEYISAAESAQSIAELQDLIYNDPDVNEFILNDKKAKTSPYSFRYSHALDTYITNRDQSEQIMKDFTDNFPQFRTLEGLKNSSTLNTTIFTNLVIASESEYKKDLILDIRSFIQENLVGSSIKRGWLIKVQEMINNTAIKCVEMSSNGADTIPQLIEMVSMLCNLKTDQAEKYLQNWFLSKSNFKYSFDLKIGENITELIRLQNHENDSVAKLDELYNLHDFARYPSETLAHLPEKYEEKEPYALSVFCKDDHNGVEYLGKSFSISNPEKNLGEDANLLLMEASSYFDIIRFIKTRIDNGLSRIH